MGEGTIPEVAVEAMAKFEARNLGRPADWRSFVEWARLALAAAGPLMHEPCVDRQVMAEGKLAEEILTLRDEVARLRKALETVLRDWVHCRDIGMDRWGNFIECGQCAPCKATADARGVLALSREMEST